MHDITESLQRARAYIAATDPFFGSLILKARMIPSSRVPTAATNGRDFWVNPDFWQGLNKSQQRGLLKHEVLHKALCHHTRRGNRDTMLWNMAADYAINPLILDSGDSLPDGGLVDGKYQNMSAEQIYKLLAEQQQQQQQNGQQDGPAGQQQQNGQQQDGPAGQQQDGQQDGQNGQQQPDGQQDGPAGQQQDGPIQQDGYAPGSAEWDFGGVIDAPVEGENPQAEIAAAEIEAKTDLQEAAQLAKMAGKLPGNMQRLIDEICEPVVNWRAELQDYFDTKAPSDYSWTVPNKRYGHTGCVLPGIDGETLGTIVFAVDVSGSISKRELAAAAAEVAAVFDDVEPAELHVLWFDTAIHNPQVFERGDIVNENTLEPAGGGGTRWGPIPDYIEKENIDDMVALVVLTDGEFWDMPDEDPGYPVLWALTVKNDSFSPAFGDILYCNIGE